MLARAFADKMLGSYPRFVSIYLFYYTVSCAPL